MYIVVKMCPFLLHVTTAVKNTVENTGCRKDTVATGMDLKMENQYQVFNIYYMIKNSVTEVVLDEM